MSSVLSGGDDVAVQVPLALLAACANQRSLLRRILNAVCSDRYAQATRETNQCPNNSRIFLLKKHAMNEAAIDLDLVHLEISQMIET